MYDNAYLPTGGEYRCQPCDVLWSEYGIVTLMTTPFLHHIVQYNWFVYRIRREVAERSAM
ncbi:hypothetical protein GCM10010965_22760 [Caldalkalibacillus thermarum]|nr:hypothetical protein GCM10010965_22760 [Caldalkalibacillus thermarum]